MEKREEIKKFEKVAKILALCVPTIVSIIVFIMVLMNVLFSKNIFKSQSDSDKINEQVGIGLTIIGIAVTVWIGLNVYNAISKKDIDELIEDTKKAKDALKKLEDNIMMPSILSLYSVYDEPEEYFSNQFLELKIDLSSEEKIKKIKPILRVINEYRHMRENVEANGRVKTNERLYRDKNILEKSENGIKLCKDMKMCFEPNEPPLLEEFYHFMLAEFIYYKTLTLRHVKKDKKLIEITAKEGIKHYKSLCETNINSKGYISNSLGMLLSFVYDATNDAKEKERWLRESIESFEHATNRNEFRSIYAKNLGMMYEKNNIDDAIKQYEKAVELDNDDYKAYYCLASAKMKKIEKENGIDLYNNNWGILKEVLTEKEINGITDAYMEDINKNLVLVKEFCFNMSEELLNVGGKNLEYCMIQIMRYRKNKKKLKKYTEEGLNLISVLEKIDKNKNKQNVFHKRNFYATIGEIDKADKLNNE